jgi:hypothetical protein
VRKEELDVAHPLCRIHRGESCTARQRTLVLPSRRPLALVGANGILQSATIMTRPDEIFISMLCFADWGLAVLDILLAIQ